MDTKNFWLVGGDRRQAALARALLVGGHQVHTYALELAEAPPSPASDLTGIGEAHCVILPLPACRGEALNTPLSALTLTPEALLDKLRPGQLVCGGELTPALLAAGEARGLRMVDYLAREELAVANALPVALAI